MTLMFKLHVLLTSQQWFLHCDITQLERSSKYGLFLDLVQIRQQSCCYLLPMMSASNSQHAHGRARTAAKAAHEEERVQEMILA